MSWRPADVIAWSALSTPARWTWSLTTRRPIVDGDESLPYPARMPRDDTAPDEDRRREDDPGFPDRVCHVRPAACGHVRPERQVPPGHGNRHGPEGSLPPPREWLGAVQPCLLGKRGARAPAGRASPLAGIGRRRSGLLHLRSFSGRQSFRFHGEVPAGPRPSRAAALDSLSTGVRARGSRGACRPAVELQPLLRHPDLHRPHLCPRQCHARSRVSPDRFTGGGVRAWSWSGRWWSWSGRWWSWSSLLLRSGVPVVDAWVVVVDEPRSSLRSSWWKRSNPSRCRAKKKQKPKKQKRRGSRASGPWRAEPSRLPASTRSS